MKKRNIVGDKIREFRIKAGITQEELALRSGLSQGYINQLENGKRNYTQKSLDLIAEALALPVAEFFKEEDKKEVFTIKEKVKPYGKRKSYKKEFLALLNDLPEHVVAHYLTLLKLERELTLKHS